MASVTDRQVRRLHALLKSRKAALGRGNEGRHGPQDRTEVPRSDEAPQ